jgi:ribosome modulation factor
MGNAYGGSVWQQGATAARSGKPASACPYPPDLYNWVTWMNGWLWATHQMAKEEEL